MDRPNPIDLMPEPIRLPFVVCCIVLMVVLIVWMRNSERKVAREIASGLKALGWMNVRRAFWSSFGAALRGDLRSRGATISCGVPDRSKPLTIRATFPTELAERFEVRRKLDYSRSNILMRPLGAPKGRPLPGDLLSVRGEMGPRLESSEMAIKSMQASLTNADDFVAVRRRRLVINLTLPRELMPGALFVFPYRPAARQIEARLRDLNDLAMALIAAGV